MNITNREDICKIIISEIEHLHPKKSPRYNTWEDNYYILPNTTIKIILTENDIGNEKTCITFLDGNYDLKKETGISYCLDYYLTSEEINNMISLIICDYSKWFEFDLQPNSLYLDLVIPLNKANEVGISCYSIGINIMSESNLGNIKINEYLNSIFNTYYNQIVKSSGFKKYSNDIRQECIYSLTKNELISAFEKLSIGQLQSILVSSNIDNIEIDSEYQKKVLFKHLNKKYNRKYVRK